MRSLWPILAVALVTACGHREEHGTATEAGRNSTPRPTQSVDRPTDHASAGKTVAAPANAEAVLLPPDVHPARGGALAPGETALSFSTRTPPAALLAWYRSPERRAAFTIGSEMDEGAEHVLSGSLAPEANRPRGDFTVRIAPGERGGAAVMVLVTGR